MRIRPLETESGRDTKNDLEDCDDLITVRAMSIFRRDGKERAKCASFPSIRFAPFGSLYSFHIIPEYGATRRLLGETCIARDRVASTEYGF